MACTVNPIKAQDTILSAGKEDVNHIVHDLQPDIAGSPTVSSCVSECSRDCPILHKKLTSNIVSTREIGFDVD